MNANRLIEEWRRQGRVLDVEGANTVLWRKGKGESVICVLGVPTSGFLYRKLLPELASRGFLGVTFGLSGGFGYNPRELRCFMFSIKRSARATSTEQSQLLMLSSSWDQIADKRSCRSCGASNGPPPLSTASRPL